MPSSNDTFQLDSSSWPIVHGSRESLDLTHLSTPLDANLHFYSSQGLTPSESSSSASNNKSNLNDGGQGRGHFLPDGPSFRQYPGLYSMLKLIKTGVFGDKIASFSMADANPVSIITEKVSDTEQRLWTSGFKNVMVFQHIIGAPELKLLARYDHGGFDFHYHGSYAFVAKKKGALPTYVMATKQDIYRFVLMHNTTTTTTGPTAGGEGKESSSSTVSYRLVRDGPHRAVPSSSSMSSIETRKRQQQQKEGDPSISTSSPPLMIEEDDDDDESNNIVGVTLTPDGTILTATKGGNITALLDDLEGKLKPISHLSLYRHVGSREPIHISNSLSVHEQGIYIVTQEEMTRVDLDPETKDLNFKWSSRYGAPRMPWYTSRLGPGSGSTPSITSCLGRDMVVITDGDLSMNLIYLDAETGKELARVPIQFGGGVDNSRLTSEQSVAVRGCQSFVVNNYVGNDAIDDDAYCTYAPTSFTKKALSTFCNALQPTFISKVCPAAFGCVAYGAAVYKLEEATDAQGNFTLNRQWGRDDLSCGTSIPLISDPKDPDEPSTAYCIGMKGEGHRWELIALDTETGEDRFRYQFYKDDKDKVPNFFANPYYAGVEAIANKTLAIGSIGGVIYLTPETTIEQPPLTDAAAAAESGGKIDSTAGASSSDGSSLIGIMLMTVALVGAVIGLLGWTRRRHHHQKQQKKQGNGGRDPAAAHNGSSSSDSSSLLPSTSFDYRVLPDHDGDGGRRVGR